MLTRRARASRLPAYRPQLATLAAVAPDDDQWLHETKYDGFRMGLRIDGDEVRLLTRNGLDWSARFPALIAAARRLRARTALLDGEVAMLQPDGRTSFQGLQGGGAGGGTLVYFVFDLLHLDGESFDGVPLEARKVRLRALLPGGTSALRYSDHVVGDGPRVYAEACRRGLEGIISKRRDQPVLAGRGRTWLKVKCVARQEFVIGGFTDPQGARQGLGALLIGHHDANGALLWAGKVGTGFTAATAKDLRARLDELAQDTCPFTPPPRGALGRTAHWVQPQLVAEIAFTEWTSSGKIRHPSFQGLRADKPAGEVTRERARAAPQRRSPVAVPARRSGGPVTTSTRVSSGRRSVKAGSRAEVAGVAITNPDRVVYPDPRLTKLDLARYYERVGEWMLPHIANRPLTLVACPSGISGPCMYIKHGKAPALPALRRIDITEKTKIDEYLVLDSVEGLVSLMQMNWLEAHTWNSTTDHLEQPDRLVFDLDPGPDLEWPAVVRAARSTRDVLASFGLDAWVKTSGGRGLHVVVPLAPEASWDACLTFSERVADALVETDADTFTTQFARAGREAQIFVDVLRNRRGSTAVSAFSPRARPGAPVSVPLGWDELSGRRAPGHYSVQSVPRRLTSLRNDPWANYWHCVQRLPEAP